MREIRFRAKRIDNNEWVEGSYFEDLVAATPDGEGLMPRPMIFVKELDKFYDVVLSTLGQYTGLKDKNDKEIYEGDIIKQDEYMNGKKFEINEVVVYYNDGFYLKGLSKNRTGGALLLRISDSKYVEAIGNEHDNKELLEV